MEVNASALAAMKTPMASLLILFIPKLRHYPGVGTAKCVLGSVCPARSQRHQDGTSKITETFRDPHIGHFSRASSW